MKTLRNNEGQRQSETEESFPQELRVARWEYIQGNSICLRGRIEPQIKKEPVSELSSLRSAVIITYPSNHV